MSEPHHLSAPLARARLVRDQTSRRLALGDALEAGEGEAIGEAFADVARALGISAISARTGIGETAIFEALADPDHPDLILLRRIARRLLDGEDGPSA
ncbi:MAG: hypothetical protein DI556_22460 [Rhodovulum sulfidophilum]|uniref:Uncharacterized protein n=1 Tax=Rhodovulum sulfidophilum TaxID=35806 RepID=A0A2W5Q2L5_RHOSU|nr:MAG: hypothetical protein DI556_22460 [Rhodovulum sulfidophilum]